MVRHIMGKHSCVHVCVLSAEACNGYYGSHWHIDHKELLLPYHAKSDKTLFLRVTLSHTN